MKLTPISKYDPTIPYEVEPYVKPGNRHDDIFAELVKEEADTQERQGGRRWIEGGRYQRIKRNAMKQYKAEFLAISAWISFMVAV